MNRKNVNSSLLKKYWIYIVKVEPIGNEISALAVSI